MKKSWLIDSNVLVYSYDETVKQHDLSYSLVEKAMSGKISACVAQQNLLEFIAVVTNPVVTIYYFGFAKKVKREYTTAEAACGYVFRISYFVFRVS